MKCQPNPFTDRTEDSRRRDVGMITTSIVLIKITIPFQHFSAYWLTV